MWRSHKLAAWLNSSLATTMTPSVHLFMSQCVDVSALMDETAWRLNKICEALTGSTPISECEPDSTALAAACRVYLAVVDAFQ